MTIAVLVGVVVYYVTHHREELRKLWQEFLAWWNGLWGVAQDDLLPESLAAGKSMPRRLPFSSFANPFRRNNKTELAELVRYTFEAMEAWGAERGLERKAEMTAEEYVKNIVPLLPKCKDDLLGFSNAFVRLAYAGSRPVSLDPAILQRIWQSMEQHSPSPSTIQLA